MFKRVGARSTFEDGGQDRRRRGEGRRRRETGSEEKRAAGLIKREPATPDPLWMCGWRSRGQTARWIGRLGCSINQETLVIGGTKPFPLPSLSTARLGRSAAGRKGQGFTGHQAQAHTLRDPASGCHRDGHATVQPGGGHLDGTLPPSSVRGGVLRHGLVTCLGPSDKNNPGCASPQVLAAVVHSQAREIRGWSLAFWAMT